MLLFSCFVFQKLYRWCKNLNQYAHDLIYFNMATIMLLLAINSCRYAAITVYSNYTVSPFLYVAEGNSNILEMTLNITLFWLKRCVPKLSSNTVQVHAVYTLGHVIRIPIWNLSSFYCLDYRIFFINL